MAGYLIFQGVHRRVPDSLSIFYSGGSNIASVFCRGKDLHHFGILCKCRWRKRNANCDRKISLPTVLQGLFIRDKKMPLGVPYYSNAKAWMDSVIMLDILNKINQKLARQKRKVILFWTMSAHILQIWSVNSRI